MSNNLVTSGRVNALFIQEDRGSFVLGSMNEPEEQTSACDKFPLHSGVVSLSNFSYHITLWRICPKRGSLEKAGART